MKTVITGAGSMGGSTARGLAKGTITPVNDITVSNPTQHKLDVLKTEFPALQITHDNQEAVTGVELIILVVRSWLIKPVVSELKLRSKQILISIAADIPFEESAHYVADKEMTMLCLIPNTTIGEVESMTFIVSRSASKEQEQLLSDIFNQMGFAMLIPEDKIAAATIMTSYGITYVLECTQAAMQAEIEMGIYPKDGMRMMARSVGGAAELILNNNTHPSIEIDKMCTPGGITVKGINELEQQGFPSVTINAIKVNK